MTRSPPPATLHSNFRTGPSLGSSYRALARAWRPIVWLRANYHPKQRNHHPTRHARPPERRQRRPLPPTPYQLRVFDTPAPRILAPATPSDPTYRSPSAEAPRAPPQHPEPCTRSGTRSPSSTQRKQQDPCQPRGPHTPQDDHRAQHPSAQPPQRQPPQAHATTQPRPRRVQSGTHATESANHFGPRTRAPRRHSTAQYHLSGTSDHRNRCGRTGSQQNDQQSTRAGPHTHAKADHQRHTFRLEHPPAQD